MRPLIVSLTAFLVLTGPIAAPVSAQGGPPDHAGPGDEGEIEHFSVHVNDSLPGLEDLNLSTHDGVVLDRVILPQEGEEFRSSTDEDALKVNTAAASLEIEDTEQAHAELSAQDEPIVLWPGPNATLEPHEEGLSVLLTDDQGLEVRGDNVTLEDDHAHVEGEAYWFATGTEDPGPSEDGNQTDDGAEDDQQSRDDQQGPPDHAPAQGGPQDGGGPPADTPATWRPNATPGPGEPLELPHTVDARYFTLNLTQDGAHEVSLHGTQLGTIVFDADEIDTLRRAGATVQGHGDNVTLHAVDAPATQITVQADNVTTTLPNQTTLPSNATVVMETEEDRVHIHVQRPSEAVPSEPTREHRPAAAIDRSPGQAPGLTAKGENASTGVASERPDRVDTSFDGEIDGVEGNVSLGLVFERALLIEDRQGNGQVDVGDPAVAETHLTNGTTHVGDEVITNEFDLWSGTLKVNVEPGDETAKVTYEATNLSAPPDTLFVIETQVQAPAQASLTPTDNGVIVDNGSLQAEYSITGPVVVDGEDAWADRSILIDDDDAVRILMAYPAGDNITHDPTVSVQSSPGAEVLSTVAASPYAIALGALGAAVLVGATAWSRRGGP